MVRHLSLVEETKALDILIYGHGDKSINGFRTDADIEEYLEGGIFRDESGRYRYSQKKRADIVVLSRDGFEDNLGFPASLEIVGDKRKEVR